MHLLKHHDKAGAGGIGRIIGVNFWPEIKGAIAHMERLERKRIAPVSDAEALRILVSVCPCWNMEHRHGVCPLGLTHRTEYHEAKNALTIPFKKNVVDKMVGNAGTFSDLITRIAVGTSADPTDVTQSALFVEVYRDSLTYLASSGPTSFDALWFFGPQRANVGAKLQEWAIMAGGAGALPGAPGVMIARFLDPFDKNIGTAVNGSYSYAWT